MKFLVSVCLPTFNGEKYIKEALSSIHEQTYKNIEVILSDDNSVDHTLSIIEKFTSNWTIPIKIIKHEPSGIGANWNNCIKHANGKYIKFLFQDDVLYPTCIEEMVNLAEKDEKIGLVFSDRKILMEIEDKEWLQKYEDLSGKWKKLVQIQDGIDLIKQSNIIASPWNKIGEPSAVLIRKDCFSNLGYFSEDLVQYLDLEYWYKIMLNYKIGFIKKKLAAFRVHNQQATQINKTSSLKKENALFLLFLLRNVACHVNFKDKVKIASNYLYYTLKLRINN